MIDDIAYLDRAVANYLSNLDAIIQDQTFSQLAMPAQQLLPGEDAYRSSSRWAPSASSPTTARWRQARILSPDPKQAQLILSR
jgi:hypothetical protein